MLAMGKMMPDNIFMARIMRKVIIIDCSWLCTIVEINIPRPRVEKRKRLRVRAIVQDYP
jgi:hypothetical protein